MDPLQPTADVLNGEFSGPRVTADNATTNRPKPARIWTDVKHLIQHYENILAATMVGDAESFQFL